MIFRLFSLKKENRPKEYIFEILTMTCRPSTSDQQLQCLSSVPVQNQVEWWRVSFATIHSFMTERLTQHLREKFQVKVSDESLILLCLFREEATSALGGISGGRKTGQGVPGGKPSEQGEITRTNNKLKPYLTLGWSQTWANTPGPSAY